MPDRRLAVTLRQAHPIPLEVDFACNPGELLAIVGPSGSGKTTILRSIAGLARPAHGRVYSGDDPWLDTDRGISWPPHRRPVGFTFQDYALFPHLTAHGNVTTALGHLPRAARPARASALLDTVHMARHASKFPRELSGGERQRVALARALARDPAVLLLDEPFAAVDRRVRRHLQDEVDQLRRTLDLPMVLVTHDVEDVIRLATHVLLLDHGRVIASGPVAELTSRVDLTWWHDAAGLGSVFEASVTQVDKDRGLATLSFAGGELLAPAGDLTIAAVVRVRIPAREVVLASQPPTGLSLHNALPATVTALQEHASGDTVIVQLAVGGVLLLAEVTRDAVRRLDIAVGRPTFALIKSISSQPA